MWMNYNLLMFYIVMVMGVAISITSNNWLLIWIGLEISLMSFIPLMSNKLKLNSESIFKYFIVQSMSSSIMMMGVIMMSLNLNIYNKIILGALIIKLGLIPFHMWILSIIEGLSFNSILILLTIQKFAPLNLISYLNYNIHLIIILSLMLSSLSSINQNSLKKILCYSSIYNLSIILTSINEMNIWLIYLIGYFSMNLMLIYIFKISNINFINQIMINHNMFFLKMSILFMMLAMGGLPPFMMFILKLMILENLLLKMEIMMIMIIILTSLLVMMFYIRISIIGIMMFFMLPKWILTKNKNPLFMMIMMMMLIPLTFSLKCLT